MDLKRRKFQGVLNILSFNRHFYVFGIGTLLFIVALFYFFDWSSLLLGFVVLAFLYGLLMPLIVSAYVYDFSGFYNFGWLNHYKLNDREENFILNINAGFDETSYIIKKYFPKSHLQVFDFYNAKQHTEPAIIRARKVSIVYPNTMQIVSNRMPLQNQSIDIIFLLSAAHEIRTQTERIAFLKECKRVCKPTATVIMVEHLRDFPNFIAFTIGFTHFFSKSTWKNAFSEAGFSTCTEQKFTPFMSIFKSCL